MPHDFTTYISDEELWEYIDGGLGQQRRLQIAKILAEDATEALRAASMRLENERLKSATQTAVFEPVPDQMASILHESRQKIQEKRRTESVARRYGFMAAFVICAFATGIVGGWLAGELAQSESDDLHHILPNIAAANSYYTDHRDLAYNLSAMQQTQIAEMAEKMFGRRLAPPTLDLKGYEFAGARFLPASKTQLSIYRYESATDGPLTVTFWAVKDDTKPVRLYRAEDGLQLHVRVISNVAFAVSGSGSPAFLDQMVELVYAQTRDAL